MMKMPELEFTKNEMIEKKDHILKRYPNLSTVLMVEDFLKVNREIPLKITEIKQRLPKQIMHQTLQIILEYLFRSGKILYGPKGIQWIYSEPDHLKKMMVNTLEI
jgi:hypothetical protein